MYSDKAKKGHTSNIKKLQQTQLEILKELDRICKANNINYQLFAGTLLGAVRHRGFIPWDDDVDVCLLRKDYDRLLKILEKDLDKKYFLQNYQTDESSILQFSKIRKNHTRFVSGSYTDTSMHEGIFIDLFPMDNVKDSTFIGKMHIKLSNFMFVLTSSMIKSRCYNVRSSLRKYIRLTLYYITRLLPKKKLHVLSDKVFCFFNDEETEYVSCLANGAPSDFYKKFTVKRASFDETIEQEFEGEKFPIPKKYDYVLTKNYGDYMSPPPLEEQVPHHGEIADISFDTRIN